MEHVDACLSFQRRSRKQFSQPCEVGARLFMRGKGLITPF